VRAFTGENLNIRVFRRRRFRSGPSNQGGFPIYPLRGSVHVWTEGPSRQTSPAAGLDRTGPPLRRRRVTPGAARARTCSDYRMGKISTSGSSRNAAGGGRLPSRTI
jgi:hypothetical protein